MVNQLCLLPAQPRCSPDSVSSSSAAPHTSPLATVPATPRDGHALPHVWSYIRSCVLHIPLQTSLDLICLNHHFDHLICLLRILQQHLITHQGMSKLLTPWHLGQSTLHL